MRYNQQITLLLPPTILLKCIQWRKVLPHPWMQPLTIPYLFSSLSEYQMLPVTLGHKHRLNLVIRSPCPLFPLLTLSFLFTLYFIVYAITVVPVFHLYPAPQRPQTIFTPLSMSMGHDYMFFGYSIPYTVPYITITIL